MLLIFVNDAVRKSVQYPVFDNGTDF